MFKGDSWNEPITMILADFDIEEVVEYFNDFYKQGYHSERFLSLKNILGVKGFSYMNHEDFEKIADANFRERNVCTGIAEEAAVKVIENESLTLKTEVIKNDGACNNYEDNDEIDETLETLEMKLEVELDEIQNVEQNKKSKEPVNEDKRKEKKTSEGPKQYSQNNISVNSKDYLVTKYDERQDIENEEECSNIPTVDESDFDVINADDVDPLENIETEFNQEDYEDQNGEQFKKRKEPGNEESKDEPYFIDTDLSYVVKCLFCNTTVTRKSVRRHLKRMHNMKMEDKRKKKNKEKKEAKGKGSEARQYFKEDSDDNGHTICNFCQLKIVNKTKRMRDHLMYKHTDIYSTLKKGNVTDPSQKKLGQYYSDNPNDPSKYNCNLCNSIITKCNIFRHIQNVHDIFEDGEAPKQMLCSFCGKVFRDKWTRDLHEDTKHKKIYRYNCSICGKGYLNNRELNEHILKHSVDKPFQCSDCGQQFSHSESLRYHVNAKVCSRYNVSGITSLMCPTCDKEFLKPEKLKIHLLRSSLCTLDNKKKPFACQHCEKSFMSEKYLEIHMRSHTGGKPFQCELCKKSFKLLGRSKYHKCIT